jgi:hypothetical protein
MEDLKNQGKRINQVHRIRHGWLDRLRSAAIQAGCKESAGTETYPASPFPVKGRAVTSGRISRVAELAGMSPGAAGTLDFSADAGLHRRRL